MGKTMVESSSREKPAGDFLVRRIQQVSYNVKPELISKVNVLEKKRRVGSNFSSISRFLGSRSVLRLRNNHLYDI